MAFNSQNQTGVIKPSSLIVFIALAMPFGAYKIPTPFINLSVDNFVILGGFFVGMVLLLRGFRFRTALLFPIFLLLIFVTLAFTAAETALLPAQHIRYIVPVVGVVGICVVTSLLLRSLDDIRLVASALIVSSMVATGAALFNAFFGLDFLFPSSGGSRRLANLGWEGGRTVGMFTSYGAFGAMAMTGAFLCLGRALERHGSQAIFTRLAITGVMIAVLAVLASQSRSSALAFLVGGAFVALFFAILYRGAQPLFVGMAVLIILAIVIPLFDTLYGAVEAISPQTVERRFEGMSAAWSIVMSRPWTGIGFNSYIAYTGSDRIVHNTYLVVAMGVGIPGAIVFILFQVLVLLLALREIFVSDENRGMAIGLFASMIACIVEMSFFSGPNISSFWMVAGMTIALWLARQRLHQSPRTLVHASA